MSFDAGWKIAQEHMPAVRRELEQLPAGMFLDFATAEAKQDMEEATDLVLDVSGGTMAVRVRSRKYWHDGHDSGDWSIRARSRSGGRTEIHKMIEGFADWYFLGFSDGDSGLHRWFLMDLWRVREEGLFPPDPDGWGDVGWSGPHPNGDGTAGIYLPVYFLSEKGCLMASSHDVGRVHA